VEFALIAPVLVLLALGVLEIGNAWRQGTGLERAAAQGARTVSSQGDGRFADYEALRAIDSATRTLSGIEVTRVVIFNATGRATGDVPPQCLTASRSNLCNTYTGEQVRTVSPAGFSGGSLAAPSCAGSWDALWCPLSRNREANPPLRIGVHIT